MCCSSLAYKDLTVQHTTETFLTDSFKRSHCCHLTKPLVVVTLVNSSETREQKIEDRVFQKDNSKLPENPAWLHYETWAPTESNGTQKWRGPTLYMGTPSGRPGDTYMGSEEELQDNYRKETLIPSLIFVISNWRLLEESDTFFNHVTKCFAFILNWVRGTNFSAANVAFSPGRSTFTPLQLVLFAHDTYAVAFPPVGGKFTSEATKWMQ